MMQKKLLHLSGIDSVSQNLMKIYSKEPICPDALNEWFSSVDFEALLSQISCMAAAAATVAQFDGVPEQLAPRLKGIIKYVHTLNSGMVSGVCAVGAKMNAANIPLLLMDDTALYMQNPAAPQRHLWQTFVGIPSQDFKQAIGIIRKAGFEVEEYPLVAVARQGVMRQIVINAVAENDPVWQAAIELKRGSVSFLCPDSAHILLEISKRVFRSLTKPDPQALIACWVMDLRLLLQQMQENDWRKAAQLAEIDKVGNHIYLLLDLYFALTGIEVEYSGLFGDKQVETRLVEALVQYARALKKPSRIRRLILRCRIRRPDSVVAATALLTQRIWRKLKG